MADEILKRDQNSAVVLGGVTDDSNQFIRMLRVDPVTNRLLVSASGGVSSGFQVPLTGGLNQTTFTWTTAPNVIVADNVPMQAISTDGTVNWTGTTTTILTIAPTFNIFAVA